MRLAIASALQRMRLNSGYPRYAIDPRHREHAKNVDDPNLTLSDLFTALSSWRRNRLKKLWALLPKLRIRLIQEFFDPPVSDAAGRIGRSSTRAHFANSGTIRRPALNCQS